MVRDETNGRIKLSVRDIVAWLVLFSAILGNWYDTRTQIALARQEASYRSKSEDVEHQALHQEDSRIWKAVEDVQASERTKQRR